MRQCVVTKMRQMGGAHANVLMLVAYRLQIARRKEAPATSAGVRGPGRQAAPLAPTPRQHQKCPASTRIPRPHQRRLSRCDAAATPAPRKRDAGAAHLPAKCARQTAQLARSRAAHPPNAATIGGAGAVPVACLRHALGTDPMLAPAEDQFHL